MAKLVFVDCEATGPCPGVGVLTEFGAVDYETRRTFHGVLHDSEPDPANPALFVLVGRAYDAVEVFGRFRAWLDGLGDGHPVFVSDNPAFDFQWISHGFWHALEDNRAPRPVDAAGRRVRTSSTRSTCAATGVGTPTPTRLGETLPPGRAARRAGSTGLSGAAVDER